MRLITWNCQGAFRKKADLILAYNPDILVVQECEHPDKYVYNPTIKKPDSQYWYGDSRHKGICIHSFNEYKFELLPEFNPKFRYVLPFRITGNGHSFTLFAIWAMSSKENYDARYIGQVWLAINYYTDLLAGTTILVGDFNSNKIWDYKKRIGDHSDVVNKLTDSDIHSIYHRYFNIEQGKEEHSTFYLQRNFEKPYHIDYCFASAALSDKVQNVEIGNYKDWIAYSDHVPVIIDFGL
ncbi:MAG: endonuclease/exonuclease/phosphatase family protein [Bacteroidales bacterium]|nr:endonuclease/exonuclease/phosphatase family protein [Bacteroidales bacterium]